MLDSIFKVPDFKSVIFVFNMENCLNFDMLEWEFPLHGFDLVTCMLFTSGWPAKTSSSTSLHIVWPKEENHDRDRGQESMRSWNKPWATRACRNPRVGSLSPGVGERVHMVPTLFYLMVSILCLQTVNTHQAQRNREIFFPQVKNFQGCLPPWFLPRPGSRLLHTEWSWLSFQSSA